MTLSELKALLEKEGSPPKGYDVLKDAREIMRGNFPLMRRMKRKLAIEGAAMTCVVLICGWLHYTLPYQSVWITVVVAAFTALLLTLQVLAFKAYWYTPAATSVADSMRKFSRRLNLITNPMKIVNICLALFTVTVIFIDANVVRILNWEIVILLLSVQAGSSLFSMRWISYARMIRRKANEFIAIDDDN